MIVEWHLTKQSLGLTMAAALVGMTGGSFVGGLLGDHFGRRPSLLGGMALFGTSTLAIATGDSFVHVLILRLVSGLVSGAVLSNF